MEIVEVERRRRRTRRIKTRMKDGTFQLCNGGKESHVYL